MNTKYVIELTGEQRQRLEKLISSGACTKQQMKRAQILLKSAQGTGWSYERIADAFDISQDTIAKVRKVFAEKGLDAALGRKKPAREYEHSLDEEGEARLIALISSKPPAGRTRWSLRLLRDRFVKLGYVNSISHETIRRTLKKTNSRHT